MRILLSNDDGVHAPGIQTLAKALREFADVQVVAPDRNRSGASNSLTLESSLRTFTFEMVISPCKWEPRPIVYILV